MTKNIQLRRAFCSNMVIFSSQPVRTIVTVILVLPHISSAWTGGAPPPTVMRHQSIHLRMAAQETVAVIGGGIAGLSCAQSLLKSGQFLPTVFDTGRLRPGGRCASRLPNDRPNEASTGGNHVNSNNNILSKTIIDHAAQILTVPPPSSMGDYSEFKAQVNEWERDGIVQRFKDGTVCNIGNPLNRQTKQYDKTSIRLQPIKGDLYFGVDGMQSIPKALMRGLDVQQDVWISPSNGVQLVNSQGRKRWEVKAKGRVLGQFDRLVIAHNGKCADRLMSTTPAKDFHRLLQVNFAPYVPRDGGKRMTLNSLYSLTFAVRSNSALSKALAADKFTCGYIKNHLNLRFISCNTRKYPKSVDTDDDVEVWTVLSSAKFGKTYKGPQENLPDDLVHEVTGLLYDSIEEALALSKGSLRGPAHDKPGTGSVLESRLQLWGAGVPLNTWIANGEESFGFLYDADYGVGACGDWLFDPSLAGAWESGRRLAQFMASGTESSVGLEGKFQASLAVDKVGIGAL